MTNPAGIATAAPARPKPKTSILQRDILGSSVKREELMHFSRQLGAFVHAGLPVIEAVRILREETRNKALQRVLSDIEDGLRQGETLSSCLDRHPSTFPEFYRGIMRSAELTGRLDVVLEQLAVYIERDVEARRKITSALLYPSIVVGMSIVTVVVLAGFVLPKFKVFYESLNAKLPLPTRMLLGFTDFMTAWWWAVLGAIVLLVVVYLVMIQTEPGRYLRDRVLLKIPSIGQTVRVALVERFCRVLASMAAAGVALPVALEVATNSLRNRVFVRGLSSVEEAMMRGEGLARPLSATNIFPGTAARMIRVGEETGSLDHQLEITAKFYEGELDHRLKKLTSMIEPAVIICMGLLVGFVAVSLVSAMYSIFTQVNV
jgi:type IV pilus assembly protein PilC